MDDILIQQIEQYCCQHSENEPEVLISLSKETRQKVHAPNMLSGHLQGRLLTMLSTMIAPKTILEIGTYTGYSAICLAEGLKPHGVLHTIETNYNLKPISNKYFKKSGKDKKIVQHTGKALEIIPSLEASFDLVFIDADKKNYTSYFDMIIPKINIGAYIITDNVLWNGKVLKTNNKDEHTQAIDNYNKKLKNDPRIVSVMLPIRDGLTISRLIH